jgi:Protein of unknown function (DUF3618)
MTAGNGHQPGRPTPTEPAELRAEIAQTRAELGETVSALAAKVDVKARTQEKVSQVRARASQTVDGFRGRAGELAHRAGARLPSGVSLPMLSAVAALTLLLAGLAARRRRR